MGDSTIWRIRGGQKRQEREGREASVAGNLRDNGERGFGEEAGGETRVMARIFYKEETLNPLFA